MTEAGLQVGLAMGAASMLSVGSNNLMLLKSGLSGRNPILVMGTVLGSYALLVAAAIAMAGSSMSVNAEVGSVLRWAGLFAIIHFSAQAFRSALASHKGVATRAPPGEVAVNLDTVLRTVWLNPLTYVELLLIPMSLAKSMTGDADRVAFAIALLAMSAACCTGYAYGGLLISRLLNVRRLLVCFDLLSGTILAGMAISLAATLLEVTI